MIRKVDIVNGAYAYLVINGVVSSSPTPEEISLGLDVLDDMALQLESEGLLTGYQLPTEYGNSDSNDDSGLADWMGGAFKKILAAEMTNHFGVSLTQAMGIAYQQGMDALTHALIQVPDAKNPGTLPKGSGNEWAYRDNKFYSEPADMLDTETDGSIDDVTLNNSDC
jgi:hypothetical protein